MIVVCFLLNEQSSYILLDNFRLAFVVDFYVYEGGGVYLCGVYTTSVRPFFSDGLTPANRGETIWNKSYIQTKAG